MRKTVFAVFALFAALAAPAFAEVSIETQLSSSRVEVGEELRLDFIVMNADGQVSRPSFPPLDGFTSFSQGHSQEISFVNGRSSSRNIFSYILIPNAEGRKKIGPFEIKVGDKSYQVAAVDVDVLPAGAAPQRAAASQTVSAPAPRAMPAQGSPVTSQDVFIKAWFDKDEAFLNEQVVLTYTLYARIPTTIKGFEKEAVTPDFWVEDFPPERASRRTEQTFNGYRYVVADIRKIALFPTKAGLLTVDPGVIAAVVEIQNQSAFDSFYSSGVYGRRSTLPSMFSQIVQRSLPTAPVKLSVLALPEDGKPKSFNGAVGHFTIESSLDKDEAEAGSPVTVRVRLKGEGNINTVQPPSLPALDGFKAYDSSSSVNVSKQRLVVEGEKVVETVIVPRRAGNFTIPELEFSYFDPSTRQYQTVKTAAHPLVVTGEAAGADEPAERRAPSPVDREDVAILGKDIRYLKSVSARPAIPVGLHRNPLYGALVALLLAAAAAFVVLSRGRESAARDAKALRARGSHRTARARLRAAAALLKLTDRAEPFYAELSKAVYGYFADRLGVPPQTVDFALVEARAADADPALLNGLRELFHELGQGRYANFGADAESMKSTYERAEKTIAGFEKVKLASPQGVA